MPSRSLFPASKLKPTLADCCERRCEHPAGGNGHPGTRRRRDLAGGSGIADPAEDLQAAATRQALHESGWKPARPRPLIRPEPAGAASAAAQELPDRRLRRIAGTQRRDTSSHLGHDTG
jgi:hypothetical protein